MNEIDIAPNLFAGAITISWHGLFSFVAVTAAVFLVGRWAPLRNVNPDDVYSIAIWAIIGGVIGGRLVHVFDHWELYKYNLVETLAIWNGGIGLWGGPLGGFIGGVSYASLVNYRRRKRRERADSRGDAQEASRNQHIPIGAIADITAPAMLLVQTIGRLGDIVNGEHCSKATDWFLGFIWTHPDSLARHCANGFSNAVQPAILYEMVWNMLALAVVWNLRGRLKPDGMLFALYLALYAAGRFAITFSREDRVWALGLQEAQYIALLVLAITVPLLIARARLTPGRGTHLAPSESVPERQDGAEGGRKPR